MSTFRSEILFAVALIPAPSWCQEPQPKAEAATQEPESATQPRRGGGRGHSPHPDRDLSKNFPVSVTFGVDYAHQRLATTEISRRMRERLETDLTAIVGSQTIQNIAVQFPQAGASSLDYAAIAGFHGDVAARSDSLRRAIQRILVDACNDRGWTIPFTQITLHQAA